MEFQSSMSAMRIEVRTSTATHSLDGISEQHVSNGNRGQNINSNSQAGISEQHVSNENRGQNINSNSPAGISEQHVSNENRAQNINSNSLPGWNFRAACQQWK